METEIKEGYIIDFISGQEVKATPEEIEAVQIFSRQLVEDYNYPINNIQTRPQFRVKVRPSDTKKEYPVDIAVFSNDKKQEEDINDINKKINIQKDISDLKAKVELLFNYIKMKKRGQMIPIDLLIKIIQIAAIIFATYIILTALGVNFSS